MSKASYIITIDCGTTNTRVILWDEKRNYIDKEVYEVGVRNTAIDGNNTLLKKTVTKCLNNLLIRNRLGYDDIKSIVASGMITSNVGLVEIPHVLAPVGKEELAKSIQSVLLEDICPVPIWFIPGIKNNCYDINLSNYEEMDIMRGEEVESIYLIDKYFTGEPLILILPGSHTKIVAVNKQGKISGCLTTISGELLSAITYNTIIADAVGSNFVGNNYCKNMVIKGFNNANKVGLSRACFSGRILNQFLLSDKEKVANYILGCMLQNDIYALKKTSTLKISDNTMVIVAGKNPLRQAFVDLLEYDNTFKKIINHESDNMEPMSGIGAYLIADNRNIV